jgi:hypothetical protein
MSYEDQSHRFVITGEDSEGHPRTILWRETDLVDGRRYAGCTSPSTPPP